MSIHVNGTTLLTGAGTPTITGIGASEFGDRGAWNDITYPTYHARDIYTGTYTYHLPSGAAAGQAPVWDGDKYVPYDVPTAGSDGVGYHTHEEVDIIDLLHSAIELQGIPIDTSGSAPLDGQFLRYDEMEDEWIPTTVTTGSQGDRVLGFSISGDLEVGEVPVRVISPWTGTITNIVSSVGVDCAPTGQDIIFDIKKNGSTLFSSPANRPTIAEDELDDLTCVPDYASFSEGDIFTMEITQIGSVSSGAQLIVQIRVSVI